jgi:mRNA-degrading endonuclease YafQ of YafQ-DinJ toxin-antitoxin module
MDDVDRQFDKSFSAAAELYRTDKYEECVETLRALLANPAIPRYHRITVGDWQEVYSCYVDAEIIWRITKRWHLNEKDPDVIESLDGL